MTAISNMPGGSAPLTSFDNTALDGASAQPKATQGPTDANTIQQISAYAGLLSSAPTSSAQGKSNGITNANGAPQIDGVSLTFSAEDMAAALLALQSKTQEAQIATAKQGLVSNKQKLEDQNAQAMAKLQEWIKNCKDAEAKQKCGGILGWFKKAFTAIASVFAVVAAAVVTGISGGAAAPLLALAALSMASTMFSLASDIARAAGADGVADALGGISSGLDLAGCVGQFVGKLAKAFGASDKDVAIVTATFTVVATIAIMAGTIAASGGAAAGQLSNIGKMVSIGARIGQAATGVASGATSIAEGAVTIEAAGYEKAATDAQADKKSIDAVIAKLTKQMEDDREDIKKVMDEMMEGMNIVSQMINAAGQSRAQLSANLSSRTMAA
jgi:hypothetical protein